MNRSIAFLSAVLCAIGIFRTALSQNRALSTNTLPNPILIVAQVPIPLDTSTITSVFANHLATTRSCGRGGDLCILYPDGALKNLTLLAGYGTSGMQGSNSIAVREPCMHWNGTKAIFSMVVGAPASQSDITQFYWQLYEIAGLGEFEPPVITRVPNQPANNNNTNPIYGTDDRIIFSSDRPRNGEAHLYPLIDEYRGELSNSGLWSLDPASGDLRHLDHAPSGDFRPLIDSYGRLIFSRWDHLQRDSHADVDIMDGNTFGSFNYSDESAGAAVLQNDRTEYYPEPQSKRTDLLGGTNIVGFEFNHFIPWQMNEDGTEGETMNHVGRHDLQQSFSRSFNDDPNLVNFSPSPTRTNQNSIFRMFQIAEDPATPGKFYGIDAQETGTHGAGQIITLAGAPALDAQDMYVTYITDRSTALFLPENGTPNATYTGHYRNPLPLSNGQLLAVHTDENRLDVNLGTYSNPVSRYAFRLKTLKVRTGGILMADQPLTGGLFKSVSYWSDSGLVNFSGNLWELDPVEVKPRTRPARRVEHVGTPEQQVMAEEGIDSTTFHDYLVQNNLAVIVSHNITNRNTDDRQQPFYLKVHGSATQRPNPTGTVYDVAHLQIFQADQLRGYGLVNGNLTPKPGRRVLAKPLNDTTVHNPSNPTGPPGSVRLGSDGSMAAFIPAHRAMTWQLTDSAGTPVVRERFWVTFQPGEVRTCASCHGSNVEAAVPKQIIPQNEPEAFRTLLQYWKNTLVSPPALPLLTSPANMSIGQPITLMMHWSSSHLASRYHIQVSTDSLFSALVFEDSLVTDSTKHITSLLPGTLYFWRVRAGNSFGTSSWSTAWQFTTQALADDQYSVAESWNMISVPRTVSDARVIALFPTASSRAFDYSGGYQPRDSVLNGYGYWMKFGTDQIVTIGGGVVSNDTIPVKSGWNMIGSITASIPTSAITQLPSNIIQSNFFGYNSGYTIVTTIDPAKAYWVKVNQDGQLVLSSSSTVSRQTNRNDGLASLNMLRISDARSHQQVLYAGSSRRQARSSDYALPPPPVEEGFDVRFATGQFAEFADPRTEREVAILVSAAASYPLTVHWKFVDGSLCASLILDGKEIPLDSSGTANIGYRMTNIKLRLSPSGLARIPATFALDQNYPNPFNPKTVIRYSLPGVEGGAAPLYIVSLDIYDLLGNIVATLVNERKSPGEYAVSWDAGDFPSGVYLYRLRAGTYSVTKKLLLIR